MSRSRPRPPAVISAEPILTTIFLYWFMLFEKVHNIVTKRFDALLTDCADRVYRSVPAQPRGYPLDQFVTLGLVDEIELVQHQPARLKVQRLVEAFHFEQDFLRCRDCPIDPVFGHHVDYMQ